MHSLIHSGSCSTAAAVEAVIIIMIVVVVAAVVVVSWCVVVVTYSETLPVEAPPSYRGVTLKYSYKITIGAQRFGCPTKLLRLPFRVLVVPGCIAVHFDTFLPWTRFVN